MGKHNPYMCTDSEAENTESSMENLKKRKPSILKYTLGNVKKKKCKIHSKCDTDDSDMLSRSSIILPRSRSTSRSRSRSRSRSSRSGSRSSQNQIADSINKQKVPKKLKGILKYYEKEKLRVKEKFVSSDEESEPEPVKKPSVHRYLVGTVPRPPGAKPGRGGGVALIVKKNVKNVVEVPEEPQQKYRPKKSKFRLSRKKSYQG